MGCVTGRSTRCVVNSTIMTYARGVGWTLGGKLISLAAGAVSTVMIARVLGPRGEGTVTLALLIPVLLAMIVNPGLGPASTYLVGSRRTTVASMTRSLVTLAGVGAAIGIGGFLLLLQSGLLSSVFGDLTLPVVLLGLACLPLGMMKDNLTSALLGVGRVRTTGGADAVLGLSGLVLTLAVLAVRPTAAGIVAAAALSYLLTLGFVGWDARSEGLEYRPVADGAVVSSALRYGVRAHLGILIQFFNYRLDVLFLSHYAGLAGVGVYAVATRIAELLWVLPSAVGSVVFSKSALGERDNETTLKVFKMTLLFSAVAGLALIVLGRWGIEFLFSSRYRAAYKPMALLLPGGLLLGAASVLANDLAGRGAPGWSSLGAATSLVATVVFLTVLVPSRGPAGAAVASTVSYTVYAVVVVLAYYHLTHRDVTKRPPIPLTGRGESA